MGDLHPSPTARNGHTPSDGVVTQGRHRDIGPFSALKEVWCKQCGFRCNLNRDIRKVDQFAGETITTANELSNGSFENWTAGSPDDWTLAGSVTEENTSGYYDYDGGSSSAKVERSGSDISLSQVMSTPSDFNGNQVIFRARVKSLVSQSIRLRMDINGTSYYSSYNSPQQRFADLILSKKCPDVVSSLTVYVLADSANGTSYVDSAILSRSGNPTTTTMGGGCPMCGSFDYY